MSPSPAVGVTPARGARVRPGRLGRRAARARAWLRRRRWAGDVGVAVVVAVPVSLGSDGAGTAVAVALAAVPLLWRRRRPVAVFAAVLVLAVVASVVLGRPLPGAVVVVLVGLYAVAARVRGPRLWAVVAAAEAAATVSAVALNGTRTNDGEVLSVWTVLPVLAALPTAAAALGVNRRVRRAYLAALEERAHRLESEREQRDAVAGAAERARIAREMHDVVAHSLTVVVTLADGIAAGARARPPHPADPEALAALATTGRQALGEMRRLLEVLAEDDPARDRQAGRRPQPGVDDLEALAEQVRAAGLHVTLTREGPVPAGPGGIGLTVYRVVQEALTNAIKHSGPGTGARVVVRTTADHVRVRVRDDGLGAALGSAGARSAGAAVSTGEGRAPVPERLPGSGRGLRGMRERAAAFGGTVHAGPVRPSGWQVDMDLPLDHDVRGSTTGPPAGAAGPGARPTPVADRSADERGAAVGT